MNITETKESIRKLGNPQFGSFREYIFAHYVTKTLKKDLVETHALPKDVKEIDIIEKEIHDGTWFNFYGVLSIS